MRHHPPSAGNNEATPDRSIIQGGLFLRAEGAHLPSCETGVALHVFRCYGLIISNKLSGERSSPTTGALLMQKRTSVQSSRLQSSIQTDLERNRRMRTPASR
eukprot:419850-Prorocentrum_minimum.AAC.2